jgi:hypothetical protein
MSTWVPVIAALLAAFAALTVPQVTFRLALRQDYIRWHRDQRAELYADLLVEAHAESLQMEYEIALSNAEPGADIGAGWYTDLRLPPGERARLGARATMFASRNVLRNFNTMEGVGARRSFNFRQFEATDVHAKLKMLDAHEALQKAIRAEMRSDDRKIVSWRLGRHG